jgi:hypothetical protein
MTLNSQWFALSAGELFPLGDCDGIEAASDIADDTIPYSVEWLADYATVKQWMSVVTATEKRLL